MAKSYYSTVLDHPADEVWAVIRPFDHYAWAGVEGTTVIEDGKAGDQIGAVRRFSHAGNTTTIRQILLAHSDRERSYTYRFSGPPPFPVHDFEATLRVSPITADDRAFVEWWATFDCGVQECDRWVDFFAQQGFAKWLGALQQFMANEASARRARAIR